MIRSLRGTLAGVGPEGIVVEVGGVGLLVHVSTQTHARLPAFGATVALETHLVVREDALELFGFSSPEERELFVAFLGVSGVGPRSAIAICGLTDPDGLRRAIQAGDAKTLQGAPGIGKRTAERLILDLRDRFGSLPATDTASVPGGAAIGSSSEVSEARAALVALGYSTDEITWGLSDADADGAAGELVRHALTRLRRAR
jgi:holliday junction DNA helicase RuvA